LVQRFGGRLVSVAHTVGGDYVRPGVFRVGTFARSGCAQENS
jgi:hypothetical protein